MRQAAAQYFVKSSERRTTKSPMSASERGEVKVLDPGGGISTDSLLRAGAAVVRGAQILDHATGMPLKPVDKVICRKLLTFFVGVAVSRMAGMKVSVIDSGSEAYIAPWATEHQPLISKGNCREIGGCTTRDINESCGYCCNRRSQAN